MVKNWSSLQEVKAYADIMARGGMQMSVVLYPMRTTYNIIHTVNEHKLERLATVVYRTGDKKK